MLSESVGKPQPEAGEGPGERANEAGESRARTRDGITTRFSGQEFWTQRSARVSPTSISHSREGSIASADQIS